MRLFYLNKFDAAFIVSLYWHMVMSTWAEDVAWVKDEFFAEEIAQYGEQSPAVPVVGDSAAVVTLPRHVDDRVVGNLVILVDEHLRNNTINNYFSFINYDK